jgi:hypothetical protein
VNKIVKPMLGIVHPKKFLIRSFNKVDDTCPAWKASIPLIHAKGM